MGTKPASFATAHVNRWICTLVDVFFTRYLGSSTTQSLEGHILVTATATANWKHESARGGHTPLQ